MLLQTSTRPSNGLRTTCPGAAAGALAAPSAYALSPSKRLDQM